MGKSIVLGPGGDKLVIILGFLSTGKGKSLIENVDAYSGCSAGAIVGFLLCLGLSPSEIFNMALEKDFLRIDKVDVKNILKNFGIQKHSIISDPIKKVMIDKYGKSLSLLELYKISGIDLHISTVNQTTSKLEHMSWKTNPNIKCIDALEASFTIPGLIEKKIIGDCCYIDGAILDPIPVDPVLNDIDEIHVLYIDNSLNGNSKDVIGYINGIFQCIERKFTDDTIKKCGKNVIFKCFNINISLRLSKEEKIKYYNIGKTY